MAIGKTESKKLKSFQKLLNQNSQSPQCNQSSRRRGVEEMFMRKELHISGNTGT